MKLRNFMLAALPALLFVGCSDQVDGPDEPNGGDKPNTTITDGYMAIKVNLPTTPASRANDNFDDGLAEEYNVQDAALLLFKGTAEASAKFEAAYEIKDMGKVDDDDNDNITTSYTKAIKLNSVTFGDNEKLYALVMLNYKYVTTFADGATTLTINTATEAAAIDGNSGVTESTATIDNTKTFAYFNELISGVKFDANKNNDGYFFMTNAPVTTDLGGNIGTTAPTATNVKTLVEIEKTNVYKTETEAKSKTAASIYVERAVAKATLKVADNVTAPGAIYNGSEDDEITPATFSVDWALGNVEQTSYIVRNMGENIPYIAYTSSQLASGTDYRFVGHVKIGTTSVQPIANLFRTYWCVDPNYSNDKFNSGYIGKFVGKETPLYCNENTFNVTYQNYPNTTRAVIKVTFGDGSDFYTINENMDLAFTFDEAKKLPISYIVESMAVNKAVENALNPGKEFKGDYNDILTITFNSEKTAVAGVAFNVADTEIGEGLTFKAQPEFADGIADKLIEDANATYTLNKHAGGVSYYDVRFRHFDDGQAPWDGSKLESTKDTEAAYGNNNNDYLGRYGMVRNNWYELEVTKINNWGSATVPNIDVDKPDDNEQREQWIAFKINVLSWAKRTQNVEL